MFLFLQECRSNWLRGLWSPAYWDCGWVSREVIPNVFRHCVRSRILVNEEALAHWELSSQIEKKYKWIFPNTRSLLPVPNFPNTINTTQIKRPSQTVKFSFPSPFPRARFKNCAQSCYRRTLSQGFPVIILPTVCKLSSFLLYSV